MEQSGQGVNNACRKSLSVLQPAAGKRIYTKEQMLALRPRPSSPLSAAAVIFVPRAARYTCFERAVSLGLADAPDAAHVWRHPVPSAVARALCARVHGLLQRA